MATEVRQERVKLSPRSAADAAGGPLLATIAECDARPLRDRLLLARQPNGFQGHSMNRTSDGSPQVLGVLGGACVWAWELYPAAAARSTEEVLLPAPRIHPGLPHAANATLLEQWPAGAIISAVTWWFLLLVAGGSQWLHLGLPEAQSKTRW